MEERRRKLSDEDINAIVEAFQKGQPHHCRFANLDPDDIESSIRFHKHVDQLLAEGGSTVRKTIVSIGVTGVLSLIAFGVYSKIRTWIGH